MEDEVRKNYYSRTLARKNLTEFEEKIKFP